MQEAGFEFKGSEMFSAQLELLIKILATNRAMIGLLCDKHTNSDDESDKLFKDVMRVASAEGTAILHDLYARKGNIDPNVFLDREQAK